MFDASIQNLPAPHIMRVLLVEDSKLIRNTSISVLSSTQNLVIKAFADTQKSAIALVDHEQFDMLLVDIELADGNGFEVIKYVLAHTSTRKQPVIMMLTNHTHTQYRKFAKHLGVKYFFDKSLDFDLAIETIEHEAERFSHQSQS
jgi:DNA-binding NarL/FixJ family response regulator